MKNALHIMSLAAYASETIISLRIIRVCIHRQRYIETVMRVYSHAPDHSYLNENMSRNKLRSNSTFTFLGKLIPGRPGESKSFPFSKVFVYLYRTWIIE